MSVSHDCAIAKQMPQHDRSAKSPFEPHVKNNMSKEMLNCVHVICNICQCPKSALEQCKQINRFKQDDNEWMAYSFKDTAQNEGKTSEK